MSMFINFTAIRQR